VGIIQDSSYKFLTTVFAGNISRHLEQNFSLKVHTLSSREISVETSWKLYLAIQWPYSHIAESVIGLVGFEKHGVVIRQADWSKRRRGVV